MVTTGETSRFLESCALRPLNCYHSHTFLRIHRQSRCRYLFKLVDLTSTSDKHPRFHDNRHDGIFQSIRFGGTAVCGQRA